MEKCYAVVLRSYSKHTDNNFRWDDRTILCITKTFESAMDFAIKKNPEWQGEEIFDVVGNGIWSTKSWACDFGNFDAYYRIEISEEALID